MRALGPPDGTRTGRRLLRRRIGERTSQLGIGAIAPLGSNQLPRSWAMFAGCSGVPGLTDKGTEDERGENGQDRERCGHAALLAGLVNVANVNRYPIVVHLPAA